MVSADGLAGQSSEPGAAIVICVVDHHWDRGACCHVIVWQEPFGGHRWTGEAITGGRSRRTQRTADLYGAICEGGVGYDAGRLGAAVSGMQLWLDGNVLPQRTEPAGGCKGIGRRFSLLRCVGDDAGVGRYCFPSEKGGVGRQDGVAAIWGEGGGQRPCGPVVV